MNSHTDFKPSIYWGQMNIEMEVETDEKESNGFVFQSVKQMSRGDGDM